MAKNLSSTAWSPFRHKAFAVLWVATVVANIGSWMYSATAAWLMTSLSQNPVTVSLVQVASTLPVFLVALPAGALADIIDKRRFLLAGETFTALVSTAFAILVWLHHITPVTLLLFVFVIEAGGAATTPAWQAIVPQLVPPRDLRVAVSMNSVGVNISRAVGPAVGGVLAAGVGIAAPFWVNAITNLATIGALRWWRPPPHQTSERPTEHFSGAMQTGIRYARDNRRMRSTLLRATAFFLFASCYWALLPLVARNQTGGGATVYGLLVGTIGASAVLGAFALPRLSASLGPNRLVAAGSIGTALALVLFGAARNPWTALAASIMAGISWIIVVAPLNVSAQSVLPEWVRARGLAVYVTVFFGTVTLGSVLWGQVARVGSVPMALFIAATGLVLAVPLTWRWQLQTDVGVDLAQCVDWPAQTVPQHG